MIYDNLIALFLMLLVMLVNSMVGISPHLPISNT